VDWSEILTQSEAEYMVGVIERLRSISWARPLINTIEQRGGLTFSTKPLLFEARVALALVLAGIDPVHYEYPAGVGESTVDFRFGSQPRWLVEVVSIGRSDAVEAATFHSGHFYGTTLSSPHQSKTMRERRQSEEGESLLVVQKIGEKVHDGKAATKFPVPVPDQYHTVVVDMRGHLGGGDIEDWKQIAYGAEHVAAEFRKYWLDQDDRQIPLRGVWHLENRMRFAATARERLHAIMFVGEEEYADGALSEHAWIACNPHLFPDEASARAALRHFPLWKSRASTAQ
jgi:hypothetical protein